MEHSDIWKPKKERENQKRRRKITKTYGMEAFHLSIWHIGNHKHIGTKQKAAHIQGKLPNVPQRKAAVQVGQVHLFLSPAVAGHTKPFVPWQIFWTPTPLFWQPFPLLHSVYAHPRWVMCHSFHGTFHIVWLNNSVFPTDWQDPFFSFRTGAFFTQCNLHLVIGLPLLPESILHPEKRVPHWSGSYLSCWLDY